MYITRSLFAGTWPGTKENATAVGANARIASDYLFGREHLIKFCSDVNEIYAAETAAACRPAGASGNRVRRIARQSYCSDRVIACFGSGKKRFGWELKRKKKFFNLFRANTPKKCCTGSVSGIRVHFREGGNTPWNTVKSRDIFCTNSTFHSATP